MNAPEVTRYETILIGRMIPSIYHGLLDILHVKTKANHLDWRECDQEKFCFHAPHFQFAVDIKKSTNYGSIDQEFTIELLKFDDGGNSYVYDFIIAKTGDDKYRQVIELYDMALKKARQVEIVCKKLVEAIELLGN